VAGARHTCTYINEAVVVEQCHRRSIWEGFVCEMLLLSTAYRFPACTYVLLVYHCVYVCMYVLSSPVRQTSSWREGERGMRKAGNGCEMGKLAGGRYAHLHAMRPGEEGAQIPANDD
jgi:hypothetical protein